MNTPRYSLFIAAILVLLVSCAAPPAAPDGEAGVPTVAAPFGDGIAASDALESGESGIPIGFEAINIATSDGGPISDLILGTNVPAWLHGSRLLDEAFQSQARTAGVTLIRIPGGSWSNYYDWLACERGGEGIDENAECFWTWAARPSDFIQFVQNVPGEVMYTVNPNGTAQEAAALVAFFNGAPTDETVIGTDRHGREWGTVGQWATLRETQGFAEALDVKYWEVGNEIYGGNPDSGTDCSDIGWEDVWTCDGAEYINGIDGYDGFRDFYLAMKAVDPSILIGAVGTTDQNEWADWGNEVLREGGELIDFYVMHHYAYFNPPSDERAILSYPQRAWPEIMSDFHQATERFAGGRDIPVAITEYNLISFQDQDNGQLMTRAVNAFYIADTIGQFVRHGVEAANHWALANGRAGNGTDYGMVDVGDYSPSPQFFAFHLWSQFGNQWLPATTPYPADTTLSVYAGRFDDGTYTLLAINKSDDAITLPITLDEEERSWSGSISVMSAESLGATDVSFNGVIDPNDLTNAPPETFEGVSRHTFEPYSITLLKLRE